MDIKAVLDRRCVCFLKENTKKDAISQLCGLLKGCAKIDNAYSIEEKVLYRENLMSTGIGLGIGIPHVRTDEVQEPINAFRAPSFNSASSMQANPCSSMNWSSP